MTTSAIGSLPSSLNSLSSSSASKSRLSQLKPTDFIKMMVTQLQHQDPLNPTNSQDLLAQMSQIGQLQSSTQLSATLQGMTQQNQISAAAGLIGKTVIGQDATHAPITGLVSSVSVSSDGVNLQLDNGRALSLANVTSIAPGPSAATTTAAGTTKTGA